ncbi:MAG: DUF2304 family protein [Candidatus Moraniibacteriota bacterium]
MIFLRTIVIIFIAFAASRAYLRFKDKSLNISNFFFWIILWSIILVIVFVPNLADMTANILGMQRGTDTMFFIADILLFYLVFRLYVKIDSIDQNLTKLGTSVSEQFHKYHKETKL